MKKEVQTELVEEAEVAPAAKVLTPDERVWVKAMAAAVRAAVLAKVGEATIIAEKLAEKRRENASGPSLLISVEEAAKLLGCSKVALYQRVDRRSIPGVVRTGRRLQFHRPTLETWLARKAAR